MPPKQPTKVKPLSGRAGSSSSKSGRAPATQTSVKKPLEPLPPLGEPTAAAHENDMYNQYDLDGHRIKSPEPTSRWGKFVKRFTMWWRGSELYNKKKQFDQWRRDRRYASEGGDGGGGRSGRRDGGGGDVNACVQRPGQESYLHRFTHFHANPNCHSF